MTQSSPSVPEEPKRPPRGKIAVAAYRAIGAAAVALAAAGVVLPILPTTPFLLVALWAFARSAPELADRLRAHPRYGPMLVAWETRRAIPRKAKVLAVTAMGASWTGLALTTQSLLLTGSVGAVMVVVGGYVVTRPRA